MKKYITLVLVIFALISVCGCTKDSSGIDGPMDVTADTIDVYIASGTLLGSDLSDSTKTASSFIDKNTTEFGIDIRSKERIHVSDIPKTKTAIVNGKNVQLNYDKSKILSTQTKENRFNRRYDNYIYREDEEGNPSKLVEIAYLANSDVMTTYIAMAGNAEFWNEGLSIISDDELRQIADEYLLSIMSQKEYDEYTLTLFETPGNSSSKSYRVRYRKFIYGYPTDCALDVVIDQNKKVVMFIGANRQKYDGFEEDYSKEMVSAVYKALDEKIKNMNLENATVCNQRLTTDIYGGFYIGMDIEYGSTAVYDQLYAKIPNNNQ